MINEARDMCEHTASSAEKTIKERPRAERHGVGYLRRAKLCDPLGGLVGGTHDKLVIDFDLETVVLGNDQGLEDARVVWVGVDGLRVEAMLTNRRRLETIRVADNDPC